jgi:hypothetical protein
MIKAFRTLVQAEVAVAALVYFRLPAVQARLVLRAKDTTVVQVQDLRLLNTAVEVEVVPVRPVTLRPPGATGATDCNPA